MKTVYYSAGKNGREIESGPFSTLERAEADVWWHDYYQGCTTVDRVSDEEFNEIKEAEREMDQESREWCEETTLDKYRAYCG